MLSKIGNMGISKPVSSSSMYWCYPFGEGVKTDDRFPLRQQNRCEEITEKINTIDING